MRGYFALILHAHLPFVRHPEHEKFLEESWLFEAVTETYVPLLQMLEGWRRDQMNTPVTVSLSPPLCAMLLDPLLCRRYERHLDGLIDLAAKEIRRTHWDRPFRELAWMYHHRFSGVRDTWRNCGGNLVHAFKQLQDEGRIEIITTAATHALLPLLANHPPSIRAQILTARDDYRNCFGRDPGGIWLPECAYVPGVETFLQEANIRWFILDTHGILHANPRPRYGTFAPVFTPNGIAAFGRDFDSSRQVWSQREGYPGDPRYRDFYRDIGFDLDFDYVKPHLPSPEIRGFTGIKYYRITGAGEKKIYQREDAVRTADEHAQHFLNERVGQVQRLTGLLDRPPLMVAPYDAELFGHWWHEGVEFLNFFARKLYYDQGTLELITPAEYLRRHPTNQIATPGGSTWGEEGYLRVWLNDKNEWILPHLQIAQERMSELADQFHKSHVHGSTKHGSKPGDVKSRALRQAARELLLAQSSDWPFILRAGTSPDYARRRVKEHLLRFIALHEQLTSTSIDSKWLHEIESRDNIFPNADWNYWQTQ
ncbi:MAG TPA: 1,4-alpha-glucan branching protein domain-containing protein [Verrucomicrobiae bacterium]|jgi:1,4-alpha-glucan branching enzyme|nr:1,4-alpha-glucan branching protein domain-containing protein [Verrucomicrobiae bacterium]